MSEGAPFRAHRGGFVTIPNETVNDRRLSFRARGVLLYLLGRPPGWRFAAERVAAEGKEGREAVATALRELADLGYYRAVRLRQADGTFVTATEVSVTPGLMPPLDVLAGHGHGGFSGSGEPPSGEPGSKSGQRSKPENQPPPASQGPPTPKGDRGTRLPDDWQPDAVLLTWCAESGLTSVEIREAVDEFRDFWHAVPGQRGRKTDWAATFRNRVRERRRLRSVRPSQRGVHDIFDAALERDRQANGQRVAL